MKALRSLAWPLAAVALSALTAFAVARRTTSGHAHVHHHHHDSVVGAEGGTFHDWLHEKLAITPEQEKRLAPLEAAYAQARLRLLARIDASGRLLADALSTSPTDGAAIDAALSEIHAAQSELQRLTIGHFLEMKEHLSPDQAEKLLQWTRESITHEHRH